MTGLDASHLSRVERGQRAVNAHLVAQYERVLGVKIAASAEALHAAEAADSVGHGPEPWVVTTREAGFAPTGLSIRAGAEYLGVATARVSTWDSQGERTNLETETQEMLDTDLVRTSAERLRASMEGAGSGNPQVSVPGRAQSPPERLRHGVEAAAQGSSRFALWADSVRIGDLSIASLRARMVTLAQDYVNRPLVPVFRDLVDLRDDLLAMITMQPDPSRLKDAYFLAGTTCAMLAYASGDLGFPRAAMAQTQAALACAEKAANPTLIAWLLGNRALTSEWYGNPRQALGLAAEATAHAEAARVPGTVLVRLASIEARAHARLNHVSEAKDALDRAAAARNLTRTSYADERDQFDEIGGILTFTEAKQRSYGGSTLLLIGDAIAAQQSALAAIDAYVSGPSNQRSYGDEALSWVAVATSRVVQPKSDLDGAGEALDAVLAMPAPMQIPALAQPLVNLRRELSQPCYQGATLARRMVSVIDDFVITYQRRTASEISP